MLTLWDLLDPLLSALRPPATRKPGPGKPPTQALPPSRPAPPAGRGGRVDHRAPGHSQQTSALTHRSGAEAPLFAQVAANGTVAKRRGRTHAAAGADTPKVKPATGRREPRPGDAGGSMQARYDAVVRLMLETHRVRVRKWRTSMSGIAWYVKYRDGSIQRLIESPRPKGPMSIAVFLHEIGHHAIGFDVYRPRCLEEYHAWRWALEAMAAHDLNITDAVRLRVHRSLYYAIGKAKRRGIKSIPAELEPFLEKPARKPGSR